MDIQSEQQSAPAARRGGAAMPPAMPFGVGRWEALRWSICFTVVVAAHCGAAALALLSVPQASDVGVDAPVVMLELPEALSTQIAPPTDAAPGPMEEESIATPPPKEETKPPEQVAEVALPVPEPPKPEPPQEQRQATAPQASKAIPRSVVRWESELAAHIERFKRYPSEARSRGDQGVAKVAFTIDHDGRLLSSRIVQSSGVPSLDQETLAMLARAQPMPLPPGEMKELSFEVPVRFNLR
jgi:protein TonB